MSKEYGYIGKEVEQAFRSNKGIFTPQDIIELDQENKWTNFGQLELIETQTVTSAVTYIDFTNYNNSFNRLGFKLGSAAIYSWSINYSNGGSLCKIATH